MQQTECKYSLTDAIGLAVKMIEPGMINTNFEETTMKNLAVDPSMAEYAQFLEKFMEGMKNAGANSSVPILVAATIYKAATDGTKQMRYIAGTDAEQLIAARKAMTDEDYMAMMKQQMEL